MVDESKPVHIYVSGGLIEKVRKKLNLSPDMPANYVVDTGLRDYLDMLKEPEVRVLEQPRPATP
jgi:hypothetical protein